MSHHVGAQSHGFAALSGDAPCLQTGRIELSGNDRICREDARHEAARFEGPRDLDVADTRPAPTIGRRVQENAGTTPDVGRLTLTWPLPIGPPCRPGEKG